MGQAVNLPDPLNTPPLGNGPSADDLLAQMAGDEIDRLLAEADVEQPADQAEASGADAGSAMQTTAASADTEVVTESTNLQQSDSGEVADDPAARLVDAQADPELAQQLDALFETLKIEGELPAGIARPEMVSAPQVIPDDPQLGQQLDALFKELQQANPETEPAESSESPQAIEPPTGPVAAPPPAKRAAETVEQGVGAVERSALAEPMPTETAAGATGIEQLNDGSTDASDKLPLYLLPLALLNAPIARCSDTMRLIIGRVAIITLGNALALLIYVLIVQPLLGW